MKFHNIIELEKRVRDQFDNDKSSGDMYQCLKELTEGILVTKKLSKYREEVDEISHEVATDLFLKLNKDKNPLKVYAWTKYIMRSIKGYIRSYLKYNKYREEVIINDPIERQRFIKDNYCSMSSIEVSKSDLMEMVEEIPDLIDQFYDNYTRHYSDCKEYSDEKISLKLSVYYGNVICYGSSNYELVCLMYRMVMKCISSKILGYFRELDKSFDFYYGSTSSLKFSESEWSYGSYD